MTSYPNSPSGSTSNNDDTNNGDVNQSPDFSGQSKYPPPPPFEPNQGDSGHDYGQPQQGYGQQPPNYTQGGQSFDPNYGQPQQSYDPNYGQPQQSYDPNQGQPSQGYDPNYGQPQQNYGPQYGQPQGYPAPGYPPYVYQPTPAQTRPSTATASGVIGIVIGALGILSGVLGLLAYGFLESLSGEYGADVALTPGPLTTITTLIGLVASGLVLYGGIQLLKAKTNKWILISIGVYLVSLLLNTVSTMNSDVGGGAAGAIGGLIFGVAISAMFAYFTVDRNTVDWLRANGGEAWSRKN